MDGITADIRRNFPESLALKGCDPELNVWEVPKEHGIFEWDWKNKCYGHPVGTCRRQSTEGPYCRYCLDAYIEECKKESLKDKVEEIIRSGYEMGTIPSDYKWFRKTGLYPWQGSALSLIKKECSAWICGDPGTGKTHVAYHYMNSLINQGHDVALGTTQAVLDTYKDHFRRNALQRARTLILDDFDKARWNDASAADMHGILDYRMRNHLPTIITAEVSGKVMADRLEIITEKRFGKSTIQRLSWPEGKCLAIHMTGENLRAGKKQDKERTTT